MNVGQTIKTVCVTTHTQSTTHMPYVYFCLGTVDRYNSQFIERGNDERGGAGQSVSTTANRP